VAALERRVRLSNRPDGPEDEHDRAFLKRVMANPEAAIVASRLWALTHAHPPEEARKLPGAAELEAQLAALLASDGAEPIGPS
jgi:hypothetical protein